MDAKLKTIALLSQVESVNLNSVAATTLYTVPTGKTCIVTAAVISALSATAGSAVATIGQSGDKDDFLGAQTLSNINAAGKAAILQPVPNATPAAVVEYTAGEQIVIDVTTAAGSACTATVSLFGFLVDA